MRHRATDVLKVTCPYCGASCSSVYASIPVAPSSRVDGYRRRRQCADCRETWPTIETTDFEALARDLRAKGRTLEQLGYEKTPGKAA
jgi:transcriptional regulator NrdR family protein